MAKSNGHSIYEFDEFKLNVGTLMLCRGKEEVSLPPKAVKTLAVLIENDGEIISKHDLIETVWGNSIVEESNLSQYLYLLRKTLGTDPDGRPYIETLRRRGYRFTGKVTHSNGPQADAHPDDASSAASRRDVERRGNVIELSEWKDVEKPFADTGNAGASQSGRRSESFKALAAVLVVAGLLAAASAAFWIRSGGDDERSADGELNFQRLTNGIAVEDATISPDGKYFVYHTVDDNLYRLWVQQTGQSTRVEIVPASKQRLSFTAFSPDSQFIYFLVAEDDAGGANSLHRVPTLGGPVAKLLTGIDSTVSFAPDGREMVFSRWNSEKRQTEFVIRASDGTGDERMLHAMKNDTPWYGTAAWSPDARSIVIQLVDYSIEFKTRCKLSVADAQSGKLVPLSDEVWDNCYRMDWRPDGRGLYMIGTKLREAMSTRRDQLYYLAFPGGRSRRITTDESRNQLASLGVTSSDAVLTVPYNRSSQIWVMDPNGDSRSAVQVTSGLNDGRPGIAPLGDGRVAYVTRTSGDLAIWTMNPDGSGQKQITVEPSVVEEVRSGGDGRFLVFSAMQSDGQHLFRMNADGTEMRQLTFGVSAEVDSSLSHDGKWVAYGSAAATGSGPTLWKVPIDGGEPVPLNRVNCYMPHFSPDDKFISCVEDQKLIRVISADDGSSVRSFEAMPASTLSFGARWTPDGRAVVYIVTQNGVSNLWSQPVDGGPPKPLTDFTSGSIYHFAYSLDGTRLFLAKGQQLRDAVLITTSRGP